MSKYVIYKDLEFEPRDDRYMYRIEFHTPDKDLYLKLYELRTWFPCFGYPIMPLAGSISMGASVIYAPYIPLST